MFFANVRLNILMLLAVALLGAGCGHNKNDTVIIIVRHAEKATGDPNTNLDPETGLTRASVLANIAVERGVTAIYSTGWCRTAQTVLPAAERTGLPINVIDAGRPEAGLDGCDPAIDVTVNLMPDRFNEPAQLSRYILEHDQNGVVLVAGHSNTVTFLVEAFGAAPVCPDVFPAGPRGCWIPDDEYHHMFVVTVPSNGDPVTVKHESFGPQ
jgi:phosphohistidine phosphatase SixA